MAEADTRTLGDLFKARTVTDQHLTAAVAAYFADPRPGLREIGMGLRLDIAAAVAAHDWARQVVEDTAIIEVARRNAVRRAILMARPA